MKKIWCWNCGLITKHKLIEHLYICQAFVLALLECEDCHKTCRKILDKEATE